MFGRREGHRNGDGDGVGVLKYGTRNMSLVISDPFRPPFTDMKMKPLKLKNQTMAATIRVSWGYDLHELTLTPKAWAAIKSGRSHSQRGAGYCYEGESFWDYWEFAGGLNGDLKVCYGDDGGVGFDGSLSDADIEEHPYKPKSGRK